MGWYENLSLKKKVTYLFLMLLPVILVMIILFDVRLLSLEKGSGSDIITVSIVFAILIILLFIISIRVINKYIIHPVEELKEVFNELAIGNFKVELDKANWKDEIADLNNSTIKLLERMRGISLVAEKISQGDVRERVDIRSDKDLLGNSLNDMIDFFLEFSETIETEINSLATTIVELNSTIAQFSSSIGETASSISETTSTIEEVRKTSQVSNDKAKQAAESMDHVMVVAEDGKNSVTETLDGVEMIKEQMSVISQNIMQLTEFSKSISEVIDFVNDIAEQSNLLAVNASIEAARAGESGKSFVIVAQEIKNMADKSKQSTNKIKSILDDIQNSITRAVMATEKGDKVIAEQVGVAKTMGSLIDKLADTIDEVRTFVQQSSLTIQEQLVGMDQIATAMENIKTAGQQNTAGAEQVQTVVANLKDVSEKLKEAIAKIKA